MPYAYRITVEKTPAEPGVETLVFEAANHDDLHQIVERMRRGGLLPPEEVVEFTVGLKLFTEIVLRHRREEMFSELLPHLQVFMKRLKHGASGDVSRPA